MALGQAASRRRRALTRVAALIVLVVTGYLAMNPNPAAPDKTHIYREVAGHTLRLHAFSPYGASTAPRPAILFFHGGGWDQGEPDQFFPQCRFFVERGYRCFSAAYRLASKHGSTPSDSVQDAREAIRFLRRHAQTLGVNPDRVVAAGGSSGGHLAAALATAIPLPDTAADAGIPVRPDALVLFNPILNLAPGQPDHDRVADRWQSISPFHHVGKAMPPTLILSGDSDQEVPVATLEAFCADIRAKGGQCETHIYPGAGHGFFNVEVQGGRYFKATTQAVAEFLLRLGWQPDP
jgi:acetyl esterase/lipase